eukprot:scaffold3777_cov55-Phaeocystis_antarctica.AAC.4
MSFREWSVLPPPAPAAMEHVVGPAEIRGDCACSDAPLVLCPPRGSRVSTTQPPALRRCVRDQAGVAAAGGAGALRLLGGPDFPNKAAQRQRQPAATAAARRG